MWVFYFVLVCLFSVVNVGLVNKALLIHHEQTQDFLNTRLMPTHKVTIRRVFTRWTKGEYLVMMISYSSFVVV